MHPFDVLIRPLLTEKSNKERENGSKYTFEVGLPATKKDIKAAVEKMFDVKVLGVTTAITRGKIKRRGMFMAKRPGKAKRAVITLEPGAKISLFDDL